MYISNSQTAIWQQLWTVSCRQKLRLDRPLHTWCRIQSHMESSSLAVALPSTDQAQIRDMSSLMRNAKIARSKPFRVKQNSLALSRAIMKDYKNVRRVVDSTLYISMNKVQLSLQIESWTLGHNNLFDAALIHFAVAKAQLAWLQHHSVGMINQYVPSLATLILYWAQPKEKKVVNGLIQRYICYIYFISEDLKWISLQDLQLDFEHWTLMAPQALGKKH